MTVDGLGSDDDDVSATVGFGAEPKPDAPGDLGDIGYKPEVRGIALAFGLRVRF